jgi:hypothetical protein
VSLVRYRGAATLEEIILECAQTELQAAGTTSSLSDLMRTVEREGAFLGVLRAAREAGRAGLVLLVDELSEFLRSKPTSQALNDDARTLQLLGEMSGGQPLWIVAAVQESIERTGDVAQTILRKIKDRYPVRLDLSTTHVRAIITGRLVRRKPGAEEAILKIHELYRSLFPSFGATYQDLLQTYPVHPATIALLDGLGDLFSQHRGIVDFVHSRIAGDESRSIPSILDRPATELLGPDSIYEHFAPRLEEFSAFYIYPRHIVPHLDALIERTLNEGDDRVLARRVIRILVLHRIHPTASPPECARLVELAACSLDFPSLDMSARFLAETILDPLCAESSFLTKTPGPGGDPRRAVYAIATEEDPSRILAQRLRRTASEIEDEDARLFTEPLAGLPESESWPGRSMLEGLVVRPVNWTFSARTVHLAFTHRDELSSVVARARARVEANEADCAVLFCSTGAEGVSTEERGPSVALWQAARPAPEKLALLKEYLAARLVSGELRPTSPTDAGLIQPAADALGRLEPAAAQAALEGFYAGGFTDPRIRVDPAVRQVKKFDRLLEIAADVILGERYPRFRSVAPKGYAPSARVYQQLLEDFVVPGSMTQAEARARSLAPAIEGLATPLGLVEIRRASYLFSPNTRGHPLLVHLFASLDPAAPAPVAEILVTLERGPFGLPHDTALFVLASLVASGLLSARKKGRSIPLEFLSLTGVETADEIGVGELISEADRRTLTEECAFLFPTPPEGTFGVRQQRDAWKETVRFRGTLDSLIPGMAASLERLRGFTSLGGLDLEDVAGRLEALSVVRDEIKVSFGAKEGLERFLTAWRSAGLDVGEVERLRSLGKFLDRGVDELIFTSHYARHQAVVEAVERSPELAAAHGRLLVLLENPSGAVVPDGGEGMRAAFAELRDLYAARYEQAHAAANRKPDLGLDRAGERAMSLLRSLAAVPGLDRPPGLMAFLEGIDARGRALCSRHVREELLRAPLCGCGFRPGPAAAAEPGNVAESITGYLRALVPILRSPAVLEALAARSFALRDAEPTLAGRLAHLGEALSAPGLAAAHLPDLLDPSSTRELGAALTQKLDVRPRNLGDLVASLAGRRLEPSRVQDQVSRWLGETPPGSLVAVEAPAVGLVSSAGPAAPDLSWWPGLWPELLPEGRAEPDLRRLETALEASFPSSDLRASLDHLDTPALAAFLRGEPYHLRLLAVAWDVLATRALSAAPAAPGSGTGGREAAPRVADTAVRRALIRRAELLDTALGHLGRELPGRMAARIPLEQLARDPWATEGLRGACRVRLEEVGGLAATWIETLDPVTAVPLEDGPLVVVVDGAPPDLWLTVESRLRDVLARAGGKHATRWRRLVAEPVTVGALDALFALGGDPVERLEARGVPYRTLGGDEAGALLDHAPLPKAGTAAVIRIATLDRRAHAGEATLEELAAILDSFIARRLEGLLAACGAQGRSLILTTDHGLSLARGRLVHGRGGPWERAIFHLVWSV